MKGVPILPSSCWLISLPSRMTVIVIRAQRMRLLNITTLTYSMIFPETREMRKMIDFDAESDLNAVIALTSPKLLMPPKDI